MVEGVCRCRQRFMRRKWLRRGRSSNSIYRSDFFNCSTISSKTSIPESSCKIYQKEFYTRKSLLSRPINKFHEIIIIKIEKYVMVHVQRLREKIFNFEKSSKIEGHFG